MMNEIMTAVQPAAKAATGGYKAVHDAVLCEAAGVPEADTPETNEEAALAYGMVLCRFCQMPDSREGSEISSCCNPREITGGIAGILEGFGLLNEETDGPVLPENARFDSPATEGADGSQEKAVADTSAKGPVVKEEVVAAGMPNESQMETSPAKVQASGKLADEYLCSFANTNNKGAEKEQRLKAVAMNETAAAPEIPDTAMKKAAPGMPDAAPEKAAPQTPVTEPKGADPLYDLMQAAVAAQSGGRDFRTSNGEKGMSQPPAMEADVKSASFSGLQEKPAVRLDGSADADAPRPVQAAPKEMAENTARIVEKIAVHTREGVKEFDVTLKPEFLGKLSIKLSMDGDGVRAQLKTGDLSVKGLIALELPALQEMLKERGVNVTRLDIAYESPAFDTGRDTGRRESDGATKDNHYLPSAEIEPFGAFLDTIDVPYPITGSSSVDFRA